MKRLKVSVFSYQPLMADVLHQLIKSNTNFFPPEIISEYDNVVPAAEKEKPDLFIMDSGERDHGICISRRIIAACPATKVVIVTGIEDAEHAVIALDCGVAGYISTACKKINIVTALEIVAAGQIFVSPHIAALVISKMRSSAAKQKEADLRRLNHREEQIARLLLKGCTNRAIAEELGLSEKTIKHYMSTLMQKFDSRNRLELAMALPKVVEKTHQYQ